MESRYRIGTFPVEVRSPVVIDSLGLCLSGLRELPGDVPLSVQLEYPVPEHFHSLFLAFAVADGILSVPSMSDFSALPANGADNLECLDFGFQVPVPEYPAP